MTMTKSQLTVDYQQIENGVWALNDLRHNQGYEKVFAVHCEFYRKAWDKSSDAISMVKLIGAFLSSDQKKEMKMKALILNMLYAELSNEQKKACKRVMDYSFGKLTARSLRNLQCNAERKSLLAGRCLKQRISGHSFSVSCARMASTYACDRNKWDAIVCAATPLDSENIAKAVAQASDKGGLLPACADIIRSLYSFDDLKKRILDSANS